MNYLLSVVFYIIGPQTPILPWQNLLHAGEENLFSGLTALSAEFTIGEGELMAHDVPLGCAPDEYDDLISGTCSHLP